MAYSTIKIPKADVFRIRDTEEAIQFDSFLREETKNKDILELKKKVWEIIRKSNDDINKRYNVFSCILLRCWKVLVDDEYIAYIYPYRLLDENKRLFCLYSPTYHSNNYFVEHNGLYETSFDITEWLIDRDITLVECSTDEMLDNAKMMCNMCLQHRLEKVEKSKEK